MKNLLELLLFLLKEDTKYLSSINDDNVNYKNIIYLGQLYPEIVIPWLLGHCPDWYCCLALWELTPKEERPKISEEMLGRLEEISDCWLAWGQAKGLIIGPIGK